MAAGPGSGPDENRPAALFAKFCLFYFFTLCFFSSFPGDRMFPSHGIHGNVGLSLRAGLFVAGRWDGQ